MAHFDNLLTRSLRLSSPSRLEASTRPTTHLLGGSCCGLRLFLARTWSMHGRRKRVLRCVGTWPRTSYQ